MNTSWLYVSPYFTFSEIVVPGWEDRQNGHSVSISLETTAISGNWSHVGFEVPVFFSSKFDGVVQGRLTTKFVRDWRKKVYVVFGDSRERWMRRSRLVAREYATTKKGRHLFPGYRCSHFQFTTITFPGAQGGIRRMWWTLQTFAGQFGHQGCVFAGTSGRANTSWPEGNSICCAEKSTWSKTRFQGMVLVFQKVFGRAVAIYVLQWATMSCKSCGSGSADACGWSTVLWVEPSNHYFHKVFLPKCQEKFTVNFAELGATGSNISFLKKKIIRMDDGILVTPGIPVARIVEAFEESFGPVRGQVIPCDNSIQLEDVSQLLSYEDATSFRSVVGMALYLGRDRPDAIFTIKEVASRMSKPTVTALQQP